MVMTASIFVAFLKMGASVAVLFLVSIEAFCPKPVFVRMAGHCVHSEGLFRSGQWVSKSNTNVEKCWHGWKYNDNQQGWFLWMNSFMTEETWKWRWNICFMIEYFDYTDALIDLLFCRVFHRHFWIHDRSSVTNMKRIESQINADEGISELWPSLTIIKKRRRWLWVLPVIWPTCWLSGVPLQL